MLPAAATERAARNFVEFVAVKRNGIAVITFMFALVGVSIAVGALDFFTNAADPMTFEPAPSIPIRKPYDMLKENYPNLTHMDVDILLIKRKAGGQILGNDTQALCTYLVKEISSFRTEAVVKVDDYYQYKGTSLDALAPQYLSESGETTVITASVLFIGKNPAKPGSASGDFITNLRNLGSKASNDPRFKDTFHVVATGILVTQQIQDEDMLAEMLKDNMMTSPFIFGVFWWSVGSQRLLILPGIAVGITLFYAWAIGNAMALSTQVMSTVPEMMVFLAMAMSIDYSFFLLSRFQEERQKGACMKEAVVRSLLQSGGIVLVSGMVLTVCWLAMTFFPVFGVDTIGYANATCVILCVAVNLIFTPTALLTFDKFFGSASFIPVFACTNNKPIPCLHREGQPVTYADLGIQESAPSPVVERPRVEEPVLPTAGFSINFSGVSEAESAGSEDKKSGDGEKPVAVKTAEDKFAQEEARRSRFYVWIAERLTRYPGKLVVPLLVYAIFLAGCYQLKDFSFALGLEVDYGVGEPAAAHDEVLATYPSGVFQIPALVIAKGKPDMIWTPEYFNKSCELAGAIGSMKQYVQPQSLHGISFLNLTTLPNGKAKAECIMFPDAPTLGPWFARTVLADPNAAKELAQLGKEPLQCHAACMAKFGKTIDQADEACALACFVLGNMGQQIVTGADLYSYMLPTITTPDNSSAVIGVTLGFKGFSTTCRDFTNDLRAVVMPYNTYSDIEWDVFHPCMMEVDSEKYVMDRFPYVLSITLALVFTIIAIRFGAAFIPLKMACTVAVPILFIYGVATLVYIHGGLAWLGLRPFSKTGAISWLVPICTVFMMIGLALDYDIFLFGRVYELRKGSSARAPCGNRRAVILALAQTGPVISAAGSIMALAFTGMFFIPNLFLNQTGFVFILGVLVDTFVVRTTLVPAVLSWAGWLNWWPGYVVPMDDDDDAAEPLLNRVEVEEC